jgi:6-phosphofructokinase 1
MILTKARVRDIDQMPGSFLHSSRVDPSHISPQAVPSFLRPAEPTGETLDLTFQIKRAVAVLQLEALVLIGDYSNLIYVARLSADGVPVIGIPASVENDVNGSHYSLGFSTALAVGVHRVHEVRAMAGSREEIAVVEMFGRTYGLTTMLIAFLAGADRVLVPEVPFDPERLALHLAEDKRINPANYALLAMSEAVSIDPVKAPKYAPELHRRANAYRMAAEGRASGQDQPEQVYTIAGQRAIGLGAAGGGAVVTELLEMLMQERLLYQPLNYLLRAGEPDGQDLLGAVNFAKMAVDLLAAGKTGRLAAYRRGDNYVDLPLGIVTGPDDRLNVAQCYDATGYRATPDVLWAARF